MKRLRRVRDLSPQEDVRRELASHLELRTQELVAEGWELAAARAEAERLFGALDPVRAECEAVAVRRSRMNRRADMWSELRQDLHYAWRGIRQNPGFTVLAVLTLGLGMGAVSAAFSLVNGVLLRPLPYPEPAELVQVWERTERSDEVAVTWPNYRDWKERATSIEAMTAHSGSGLSTVLGGSEPVRVGVAGVARDFFRTLGVRPRIGRDFLPEEQVPGGRPAVIVSDRFWREQLGAEPSLAGRTLQVEGVIAAVVGVMPPGAWYPVGTDVWWPQELQDQSGFGDRTAHNFEAIARLKDGIAPAAARAELDALTAVLRTEVADIDAQGVNIVGMQEQLVGDAGRPLLLFLGASALVLLIACTNLASALLARATARQRELAVRAALGAHRARLIRQMLTENLLLALLGAAVGLSLTFAVLALLARFGTGAVPRLADVHVDGWVTAFTVLVAFLTALLFGLLPALRAARTAPFDSLREGERGGAGPGRARVWNVLVSAEIALAIVLLVGAGLLVRSFWNVIHTDPGFRAGENITVSLSLPDTRFPDDDARIRYYDQLLERVRSLPGVTAAGLTRALPLRDFLATGAFYIQGDLEPDGNAGYGVVSPGYFETMGVPLVEGRLLDESDRAGALPVVVINRAMAERLGGNPIGQRFSTGGMDRMYETYVTVVGVVDDTRHRGLLVEPIPEYFLPYAQRAVRAGAMTLVVQPAAAPGPVMMELRRSIRELDSNVPIELASLRRQVGESVADRRFAAALIGGFAAIALVLAALGIYAVVAYAVARRTRELGIRIALGAHRAQVFGTVLRIVSGAVAFGVGAGLLGAGLLTRTLESMLYGVTPADPITFAGVTLVLLAAAALAVIIPSRRALRISPLRALRMD